MFQTQRSKKRSVDQVENAMATALNNYTSMKREKLKATEEPKKTKDEDYIFCENVQSILVKLKGIRKLKAKKDIMDILFDAELKSLTEDDDIINEGGRSYRVLNNTM